MDQNNLEQNPQERSLDNNNSFDTNEEVEIKRKRERTNSTKRESQKNSTDQNMIASDNEFNEYSDQQKSTASRVMNFDQLNSVNILLKDKFQTTDSKIIIDNSKIGNSERIYKTVLDYNNTLVDGSFSLTYYQIFGSVLINAIYQESMRLGIILKNREFLRNLVYEIVDSIPARFGRRNQGFLKKNMMASRQAIHAKIKELLDDRISKSREPHRSLFVTGLSAIIEMAVLSQLLNYDLIDTSELSRLNLVHAENARADIESFLTVKNMILANKVHNIIKKIIGSTSRLVVLDTDNDSDKSVDIERIISGVVEEVDRIADSLLLFESTSRDLDDILIIARVSRDREIISNIEDLRDFVGECNSFVASNLENFNILLDNREFNLYMDDISFARIKSRNKQLRGMIAINKERYVDVLSSIKQIFLSKDSLIQMKDKEAFTQQFSIRHFYDDTGRCYAVAGYRNFCRNKGTESFEMLGFRTEPSRDLQKISSASETNANCLINYKHRKRYELNSLVDQIQSIPVQAIDLTYNRILSEFVPKFCDFTVHQYATIYSNDLKKLAALNSDKILVPYISYCSDILAAANKIDESDVAKLSSEFNSVLPYYVTKLQHRVTHFDVIRDRDDSVRVFTQNPLRVIEQMDSKNGKSNVQIISDRIKQGNNFMSKSYMRSFMNLDLIFWPDSRAIRMKLFNSRSGTKDIFISMDMDDLFDPISPYSSVVSTDNKYKYIIDSYISSLKVFIAHNLSLAYGVFIEDERNSLIDLKNVNVLRDLQQNWTTAFALGSQRNVCNWIRSSDIVQNIMNLEVIQASIRSIERGYPICLIASEFSDQIKIGLRDEDMKRDLLAIVQDLLITRSFGSMSFCFNYYFTSLCYTLYMHNEFFKAIVDGSINDNLSLVDEEFTSLNTIISLFSKVVNSDIPRFIVAKASIAVSTLILAMLKEGGDLRSIVSSTKRINDAMQEYYETDSVGQMLLEELNIHIEEFASQRFSSKINDIRDMSDLSMESYYKVSYEEEEGFIDITSEYVGPKIV